MRRNLAIAESKLFVVQSRCPVMRLALAVSLVLIALSARVAQARSEFHELLGHVQFTLADAVRVVQGSYAGYAVDAELETKDGMYYYRVALVDAGGRTNVFVNPANGVVIGVQREEGIAVRLKSRWQRELSATKAAKVSLVEAIAMAAEISGGHIVEIDFRTYLDPPSYFVRIIKDDKQHEVSLGADNGAILEQDSGG